MFIATNPLTKLLRRIGILPTPAAKPIDPKITKLWLYDNIAFPSPSHPQTWSAEFIAAIFSTASPSKDVSKVVADIAEKLGLGKGDEAEARIAERVQPFLDLVQVNKSVEVVFGDSGHVVLGPSDGRGVCVNHQRLPGNWRDRDEVVSRDVAGLSEMVTRFYAGEGWAVVSDIDDTIKVTKVRDRLQLLKHTFALPSEAVAGMSDFYTTLNANLTPAWFYLSASPYNLFPTLTEFVKKQFPRGQLLLREMNWQELNSFIMSVTVGTQQYKEKELARLMENLPRRKWVFIGDSTQKDPEAYAATYRKHPEKVKKIWIRAVKGVNEREEKDLNSEARFAKAFEGVPKGVWRTFEEPGELERELDTLSG